MRKTSEQSVIINSDNSDNSYKEVDKEMLRNFYAKKYDKHENHKQVNKQVITDHKYNRTFADSNTFYIFKRLIYSVLI